MSRQSFSRIQSDLRPSFSRTFKDSIDTNATKNYKDHPSMISSRQSLTRLSLNSFAPQFDRLHIRRPSVRQKQNLHATTRLPFARQSFQPQVKKQTIVKNLMDKLEHQDELRSIIQSKYISNNFDKQNLCSFKSQSNDFLLSKLKQSQKDIDKLKTLLIESQAKVRRLEQEKSHSTRLRTVDKSTQTQSDKQERFLENLDSVIEQLDSNNLTEIPKYRLY